MLSLRLLHAFTAVCFLSACGSAVTTETVVGVAGRRVTLPCRSEAASLRGVDLCWGRGQPSLFTCHNTVINTDGGQVTFRKSYRYLVSSTSTSSLSIFNTRPADSGFYHCRVQLPGIFNDQTSTVHLIIINSRSLISDSSATQITELSNRSRGETLNAPQPTTGFKTDVTPHTGSDVTGDDTTGSMVALVQAPVLQQQQINNLQSFITNTLRATFIIFMSALLLTASHRVWTSNQRSETDKKLNQSEEDTTV